MYSSTLDGSIELLLVFISLSARIMNDVPSVRNPPTDNHSDLLVDVVDASVGALHQHLRKD